MQIVGIENLSPDARQVHTIDIWFSDRRRLWVVERLDVSGDQIGLAETFAHEADAAACVASWLRAHGETHLVAVPALRRAVRREVARRYHRSAA